MARERNDYRRKGGVNEKKENDNQVITLSTITQPELEALIISWNFPRYRAKQVWQWLRNGVLDPDDMANIPKSLRHHLIQFTKPYALEIAREEVSQKDGTIKRAYKCRDGQLIESVLMPYDDGRYTACISSQAGCAQGCVFCATGQMGFARQLTEDEIVEQVSRFTTLLQERERQRKNDKSKIKGSKAPASRLRQIVFMGMGEPLANYRNVKSAVRRIVADFGIGARRITVSTVGIVNAITKLTHDPEMPQVRLAVSLHCATDEERSELLPANRRNGGLQALMTALKEYIDTTGRRVTLEWALIEGENDSVETARQLGRLITREYHLRRDMVHINVIPLNKTPGYSSGKPSRRGRVNAFCSTLQNEFGIACTPRMRRGIDISAGCGQLKAEVMEDEHEKYQRNKMSPPKQQKDRFSEEGVGGFGPAFVATEDASVATSTTTADRCGDTDTAVPKDSSQGTRISSSSSSSCAPSYLLADDIVDFESIDDHYYKNPEFTHEWELQEAARLVSLVKGTKVSMEGLSSNDDVGPSAK